MRTLPKNRPSWSSGDFGVISHRDRSRLGAVKVCPPSQSTGLKHCSSGGAVYFNGAVFSGSMVSFSGTRFSGSTVSFSHARFSGSTVSFSEAFDWSHPPQFDWNGTPPPGVLLPAQSGGPSS